MPGSSARGARVVGLAASEQLEQHAQVYSQRASTGFQRLLGAR